MTNDEDQWAAWKEYQEFCRTTWEQFVAGFRRSQNGDLWREFEGKGVTVFRHRDGTYGWSIDEGGEVSFSSDRYEDEESAMFALFQALGW
jgi:hypothetical protein